MADGAWAPLSLQRDSYRVMVYKPAFDQMPYVRIAMLQGEIANFRTRPDLARSSGSTVISMEFVTASPIAREEIQKALDPVAHDLLADLKDWIRFLARQYWIGHKENFIDEQHYNVNLIDGTRKEPLSSAGAGLAYDYYKLLDNRIWEQIGAKLRGNEKPRPGQLFFCDGLLGILGADLASAVLALGISCELEVFSLIEEVLELKHGDQCKSAEEIEGRRFREKLSELEAMCGRSFFDFDPNADRLVKELYALRGKAAHRAHLPFEDPKDNRPANAAKLLPYVRAVEKLFAWLDIGRLVQFQNPRGT